jgi:hypothetical protein
MDKLFVRVVSTWSGPGAKTFWSDEGIAVMVVSGARARLRSEAATSESRSIFLS